MAGSAASRAGVDRKPTVEEGMRGGCPLKSPDIQELRALAAFIKLKQCCAMIVFMP